MKNAFGGYGGMYDPWYEMSVEYGSSYNPPTQPCDGKECGCWLNQCWKLTSTDWASGPSSGWCFTNPIRDDNAHPINRDLWDIVMGSPLQVYTCEIGAECTIEFECVSGGMTVQDKESYKKQKKHERDWTDDFRGQ